MTDKYTLADARADGKRVFRWSGVVASVSLVAVYGWSITTLDDSTGGARLVWFLLPLPFFAFVWWSMLRHARLQDELARRASDEAGHLTAKFAVMLLFVLALAESAWGSPISIPGPFGLPPETLNMFKAGFLVLIFYCLAGMWRLKRYTPDR